jgi:hypothetical protein
MAVATRIYVDEANFQLRHVNHKISPVWGFHHKARKTHVADTTL